MATAALTLPPLPVAQRRLDNGLHVVAAPEPGGGTVAVRMWYRVGSKDDPPGRSGFAHLFEHLMFKGTKHMADEAPDCLTEDMGGVNNAFAAPDVTACLAEVPSNHLERMIWAGAERLAHPNVDAAKSASERDVVKEECRRRVDSDPYGRLFNELPTPGFIRHPYRRPGIGILASAALQDGVGGPGSTAAPTGSAWPRNWAFPAAPSATTGRAAPPARPTLPRPRGPSVESPIRRVRRESGPPPGERSGIGRAPASGLRQATS